MAYPLTEPEDPLICDSLAHKIESAADNRANSPEPLIWDIDGMLEEADGPAFMFGMPGSTKSLLAAKLLHCMVTGEPFIGRHVRKRPSALYINADAGAKTFRRRMHRISGAPGYDYVSLPGNELTLSGLRSLMRLYPRGAIAIDCLANLYHAPPNVEQNDALRQFVQSIRDLFAEYEANGVVVDHPRRPGIDGKIDFYGGIQKLATTRVMWKIEAARAEHRLDMEGRPIPNTTKRATISCEKFNEGDSFAPVVYEIDFAPDVWSFNLPEVDVKAPQDNGEATLITWAHAQKHNPFTVTRAIESTTGGKDAGRRRAFWSLVQREVFVLVGPQKERGSVFVHADYRPAEPVAMLAESSGKELVGPAEDD